MYDFFFQAEEGMRCLVVTGVQTCALPIFSLLKLHKDEPHTLGFTMPLFEPLPPCYFVRAISNRWLGVETIVPLPLSDLTLPSAAPVRAKPRRQIGRAPGRERV